MHDLGTFRANLDAIAERLSARGLVLPLDEFRELDRIRRAAITESEQLKAEQNTLSREIGVLKKQGANADDLQVRSGRMRDRISELATNVDDADARFREMLAGIPNGPHRYVPA